MKLLSERYPDPDLFPHPRLAARPLADLLKAIAALLARRQPHNAPLRYTAWIIQQIVTEGYRILGSVSHKLGKHTPAAWIQVFKQRLSCGVSSQLSCLNARSLWFLPTCLLGVFKMLLMCTQPFTVGLESQPRVTLGVVSLVRVPGLSPSGWSVLELTQLRLVLSG